MEDVRQGRARLPRHDDRLHGRPDREPRRRRTPPRSSEFIRIATTEGQQPGYGNGELPAGLPALKKPAPRAAVQAGAGRRRAIAEQNGARSTGRRRRGDGTGDGTGSGDESGTRPAPAVSPTSSRPSPRRSPPCSRRHRQAPAKGKPVRTPKPEPVAMPDTEAVSSALAGPAPPACCWDRLLGALADQPAPTRADPTEAVMTRRRRHDPAHRGSALRSARTPRSPHPTPRPAQALDVVSTTATMLALVATWAAAQMLFLGGLSQHRAQAALYDQFRGELAAATAPIGPVTPARRPGRAALDPAPRRRAGRRSRAPPPATCSPGRATCATRCSRARSARPS